MSLGIAATAGGGVVSAEERPAAQHEDGVGGGTNMTGQPGTTPLPGSDVPTPFDAGKNRTQGQRKAGKLFDNVPVDPGPAAPSPEALPPDEDRTIHTAPPKAINPVKPQPPR